MVSVGGGGGGADGVSRGPPPQQQARTALQAYLAMSLVERRRVIAQMRKLVLSGHAQRFDRSVADGLTMSQFAVLHLTYPRRRRNQ